MIKSSLKALTKDSLTYGMANMLSKVIGFLLLPLYTTYLTPADYGVVSMLAFVYLFFVPMASMGVTNAIFRRYNLKKDVQQQQVALSTGSIFVLITSCLYLGLGWFLAEYITIELIEDISLVKLTKVTLLGSFFASIGMAFTVILRAKRKVIALSIARIIELTFTILLTIFLVVFLEWGVAGIVYSNAIGAALLSIIQTGLCKNDLKGLFSWIELKALLQYGLPYLPHRLLTQGINFLGIFMIKEFGGLASAGLYNVALKFAIPLTFIIGAIQNAWVPIKFQIHREQTEDVRRKTFRQIISTYFMLITFLFAGLVLFGPDLLRLMTQIEYHDAIYVLPFLLVITFGQGVYYMSGTGFEFTNDTKPIPLISLAGLITLGIVGFLASRSYGIYGVLSGMAMCWFVMAAIVRYFATKRFYIPINFQLLSFTFFIVSLTTICGFIIQPYQLTLRISLGTFIMLSVVFVLIWKFTTEKDFKELDLNKYPVFGKFNKLLQLIKR